MPSSGMFSSKDRFFEIRKQRVTRDARKHIVQNDVGFENMQNKDFQLVYRSSHKKGDTIYFNVKKLKSAKLCDNDFNLPFQIILMKYKSNGSHYPIAHKEISLTRISSGSTEIKMENTKKFKGKENPVLQISGFKKTEIIGFSDFLKGGLNLTQFMGIDFTLSNGQPDKQSSLHYLTPGKLNQYQRAILSLGEILEKYNTSGILPCYGFGAKLPNGQMSFDFPLNLNYENPYLLNYGQVFQCYQNVLSQIRFSGPTNFAPLLRAINTFTHSNMANSVYNYTVFTIITDGAITDMEDTVIEIVKASSLPLSIIIIGKAIYEIS
jgi:hypothetical protein